MAGALLYVGTRFDDRSLPEWLRRLTPAPRRYARSWSQAERVREISNMVVYRLPHLRMGNCLKLSLLRYIHLRKLGFNPRFHMGVKPNADGVTGHAWLTLNGELLWENDAFVAGFRETFSYPPIDKDTGEAPEDKTQSDTHLKKAA